jgi:uncharacterized protein (TIGR02266 family)
MAWNATTSMDDPSPGRRRGRATAMVVLELGLDEAALADALTWARRRADELLAALDDAELRALLEPEPPSRRGEEGARDRDAALAIEIDDADERPAERAEAATEVEPVALVEPIDIDEPEDPSMSIDLREVSRLLLAGTKLETTEPAILEPAPIPTGAERRTTPRWSLIEPAVVAVSSWHELVALYTRDIGAGGMFVETSAPPERDAQVAVQLLLPDGTGALDFQGVVVHVVTAEQAAASGCTPGFGLQFSGLSPERRHALQRLVEQAEAAAARASVDGPTQQQLGEAYRRLVEATGATGLVPPPPPFGSTPPHRAMPVETPAASARAAAARSEAQQATDASVADTSVAEPAVAAAPPPVRRARTTPPPVPPSLSPLEADQVMAQQRARMARRLASNLSDRGQRMASPLERRTSMTAPPPPPRDESRALVDEALRLVADKRYAEAAERLELAVQRRPELRTRVLLCVVQARQALTERDFVRARARYEAVLQLDPGNALAQRELLMLSALQR